MEKLMNKVGCHPPYWKSDNDLPVCSTTGQMDTFPWSHMMNEMESFDPPCREIDRLDFSYREKDIKHQR